MNPNGSASFKSYAWDERFFNVFLLLTAKYLKYSVIDTSCFLWYVLLDFNYANTDRQLLSKAFLDIFTALSKESNPDVNQLEHILEKIKTLLENTSGINDPNSGEEVHSKLRELVLDFKVLPGREDTYVPILEVYKSSLEERADIQRKSLRVINTYLNSVTRK